MYSYVYSLSPTPFEISKDTMAKFLCHFWKSDKILHKEFLFGEATVLIVFHQ